MLPSPWTQLCLGHGEGVLDGVEDQPPPPLLSHVTVAPKLGLSEAASVSGILRCPSGA